MKLRYLSVEQLPGIDEPLRVADLGAGVTVIVGPNASGKSSLVRALLALLYPREHDGVLKVEAEFHTADGVTLSARRLGQDVAWEHDGRGSSAPALPPFHLIGTYTLKLEDLVTGHVASTPTRRGGGRPAADAPRGPDGGGDLDAVIADSIGRELTGGIDLGAVRRGIGTQAEAGKKLSSALQAAARERKELDLRREALYQREARLPAQRAELAAARETAGRSQAVEDAAQLLAARAEASEIAAERATFPPDMDRLAGDEDESLARLWSASRAETARRQALDRDIDALRLSLDTAAIAPALTAAEVQLHLDRAERLVEDDARLAQKTNERQALLAQFREAGRRLGSEPGERDRVGDIKVTDQTIQRVEELLERRQSARAGEDALLRQRSRLQQQHGLWPSEPAAGPDAGTGPGAGTLGGSDDQLSRLRANLLRWLSVEPLEPRRPLWGWGLALLLVTAVVAANSLGVRDEILWWLAGASLGWLALLSLVVPPVASVLRRQVEAETDRARALHGVSGPSRWAHDDVAELIVAVDAELAARRRREEVRQERVRTEGALEVDLAAVRGQVDDVQQELNDLRAAYGFAVGPDVLLGSWLHAVRDLAQIRTALAGVQAERALLLDRVKAAAADLRAFLGASHQAPDQPPGPPTGPPPGLPASVPPDRLRAAVRGLARAVERRDADRLKLASLAQDRERSLAESARLAGERTRLCAAAGVVDGPEADDEVRRRLAALPAWKETSRRQHACDARLAVLEHRLNGDQRLLAMVEAGDSAALEDAAVACENARMRVEDLVKEISQTERDIDLAASDRSARLATARLDEAAEALRAHREEAMRHAAASFLLDAVEAEHESEARPPALARAAELFERFTRGAFTLRFEGGGTRRRLAAADRSGRVIELKELSTGTRAHMLIASRLAFALEAEAGAAEGGDPASRTLTLPFFLDEALTTSDPERFAAVAAALLDVAAVEGRQVIYLSARGDDAVLWRRAAAAHGSGIAVVQLGSQGAGNAASPAAN